MISQLKGLRIAITGSCSYIGSALLQQLVNKDIKITALYRSVMPEHMEGMLSVCCDLMDKSRLEECLRGCDAVVHLAWCGNKGSKTREEEYNLQITKNVLLINNDAASLWSK